MADSTQVKELTAKLEQGVKDLFNSDTYADYLRTMSRFHKYSTRNTLLIHLQKPDATLVAGFSSWQSKFERHVVKGAKAIKILAPVPFTKREEKEKIDPETRQPIIGEDGLPVVEYSERRIIAKYNIVNVFDVSQTDGKALPTLVQDLTGNVEQYTAFMDALREISPLPIVFEPMDEGQDGYCRFGEKIAIREGMSEVQTICAVIHEMTHNKLHDLEALRLMDENAVAKDRRTEEVEAESVSYAVCQYFGIETGANSFGYLAEWSKGRELKELNASLEIIRKTANEMIDGIDGRFREIAKERDIAFAIGEQQTELDKPAEPMAAKQSPVASADAPRPSASALYAKYCNIIAEKAAQYAVSSATIYRTDETEARRGTDQIVNRVVNDLLLESNGGEHYYLYNEYMENPDFKARLEDYIYIKAYLEPLTARQNAVNETPVSTTDTANANDIIAAYKRNAEVSDPQRVGSVVLMTPVFDDMNFNRSGKKIRVTVEEPAGKYQLYSRDEHDQKMYYLLTASGRIDRLDGYFQSVWNEQTHKRESYRPTEKDLDEVIPKIAERFESDMADPTKWALYQHAAVLNRIDDCEAHNVPVRELRNAEREARSEAAEQARQKEQRQKQDKYDSRVYEIAKAIEKGTVISVGYNENEFDGKNPVLDLFKMYDIALPLRTQGWVNTGLAEITEGSYRYYKSKHKGNSSAFGGYLKKLREAVKLTPIEQKRQYTGAETEVKKTVDNKLYEKFAELFPNFINGDYAYMRLESKGFEPLSLEWLSNDRISVMHTYELNGDLCYDPMIEFTVDRENGTMTAAAFQQSIPPLYQSVEENGNGISVDGNGNERTIRGLERQINDFSSQWFDNIGEQGFMPVRGTVEIDGEDVRITFDEKGNPIMPEAEKPEVQIGDVLLMDGKKWLVEKIDGDFSIDLKNLDPNDIQSNQKFMGRWKEKLEETGFSILPKTEIETPVSGSTDKQYDLGYGSLGNGTTVYNRAEEKNGDYVTVAHIQSADEITFYDKDMPDNIKESIIQSAKVFESSPILKTEMPEKEYHLGYGFYGNGITVWNSTPELDGGKAVDIALIKPDRSVTYYDNDIPHDVKQRIDTLANSPDTWAMGFSPAPENIPPHIDGASAPTSAYEAVKKVLAEKGTPEFTESDFTLPDTSIGFSELNLYGYAGDDMFPLTNERAAFFFDKDHTVYLLYPDNTEAMAFDREEILNHDGLCGIERADWERSPIRAAHMAIAEYAHGNLEAELLHNSGNRFGIYQIPDGIDEARNFRFASMRELEALGLNPNRANYEIVYTAPFTERVEFLSDRYPVLNNIYAKFNTEQPSDYTGRSVSVSDVIALKCNDNLSVHFVDSTGFIEIGNYTFFGEEVNKTPTVETPAQGEPDTLSQVGTRSNEYNGKTVAELESDVKAGKVISIMDLSNAVNAEKNPAKRVFAGIPQSKPKSRPSTLMERLEEGKRKAAQGGQKPASVRDNDKEVRD